MIGERVGDWIIDAEAGHDHAGRTFAAHAADGSGTKGVVRLLPGRPEVHEIFRGRLNLLRKLSHPNLVAFLESGISHGEPYFVAEHVDGQNFETLIKHGERPAWPEVLAIALQVVSALRYSHRRSVLHGDLKPAHLFRTADGTVKLAECGVARLFEGVVPAISTNPLGSVAFLSPEQAAGKPASKRSDFYSLGCLLYALLTGRPPFVAANQMELVHKHCFVMPERPAHYLPDLPDEFDALVMRLLAKDPQARPGSGTLLLAEFERLWAGLKSRGKVTHRPALATDEPVPHVVPPPRPPKPSRIAAAPPRGLFSRPLVVIPLFLLVVGALVTGFYFTRSDPDDLWARAQPLMNSDDPADWEQAWGDYLEPLSRRHPDRYAEEIRAFRARTQPAGELKRSILAGRSVKHSSEAERFYQEGVKLCQAGDFAAARRMWDRVVAGFEGVASESHWVELAKQASARVTLQDGALRRPASKEAIESAINRSVELKRQGRSAEATAVLDALEALYRDDPDADEIRRMILEAREKR